MRLHRVQIGGLLIGLSYTTFLIDLLLFALPVLFITLIERKKFSLREMGFPKGEKFLTSAAIAAKIFLALIIFSIILSVVFNSVGGNDLEPVREVAQALAAASPITFAYFFVVRVFAEEFFFRAFLVPRIGVIGSSILFGAAHFTYGSWAEVVGALVLGLVLSVSYRQFGKIVPNFIAHMLYNLIAVLTLVTVRGM